MLPEPKTLSRALSFSDVVVMPGGPLVLPDKVSLDTSFTKTHTLKRPLLATVDGPDAAIDLIRQGCVAVLPHRLPFGRQIEAVRRIKRHQAAMVRQPHTVTPDTVIAEAQDLQANYRFSALPVIDPATQALIGLVTRADIARAADPSDPVSSVMVTDLITVTDAATDAEVQKILQEQMVGQVPVVDSRGRLLGLRTASDFAKRAAHPHALLDAHGRLLAAAEIKAGADAHDRVNALLDIGADILVVTAAHGHSAAMQETLTFIRRQRCEQPVMIVAGPVQTGDGARALIDSGADALFVPGDAAAIGENGIGVPAFTALQNVCDAASLLSIPVWLASERDVATAIKALAAGAHGLFCPDLAPDALPAWSEQMRAAIGQCGAADGKSLPRVAQLAILSCNATS